ncbi:hypothetical protein BKA81DRAFT_361733 [Phyllosticta paracitricarpa]
MARGNQREKAREKNQKAQAGLKNKNNMSGSEFQRAKEDAAAIMRAKQAAGTSSPFHHRHLLTGVFASRRQKSRRFQEEMSFICLFLSFSLSSSTELRSRVGCCWSSSLRACSSPASLPRRGLTSYTPYPIIHTYMLPRLFPSVFPTPWP